LTVTVRLPVSIASAVVPRRRSTSFSANQPSSSSAISPASVSPRRNAFDSDGRMYGASRSGVIIVTFPSPPASR
jgi:hypothetical protein